MLRFSRLPDEKNIGLIYAKGSQSGYTPDTIMDFIVTNSLANGIASEGFLETGRFANGNYTIQVFVADFMGNKTTKEIQVKIEN